jgi:gamma-glutamylcyclotransferase (GGCT)/AIG2-like uncharacterized protein YtfP
VVRTLRLFVYGSLRRDVPGNRQDVFGDAPDFLGRGRVRGRLLDLGAYPGLVPAITRNEWVHGELYAITGWRSLARLDAYEDYDPRRPERSLFLRREVRVTLDSGESNTAWAYFYAGPAARGRHIASGDYLDVAAGGR